LLLSITVKELSYIAFVTFTVRRNHHEQQLQDFTMGITNGINGHQNGHTNGHANGIQNGHPALDPFYKIVEQPIGTRRPIRVACMGAGYSGLMMAIVFSERMKDKNAELVIYERNEDLGGTWLENRYVIGLSFPNSVD
jgi:hypothetical protein